MRRKSFWYVWPRRHSRGPLHLGRIHRMGAERIGHDFKLISRTDVARRDEAPIEHLADLLEWVEIETGFEREAARPLAHSPRGSDARKAFR